MSSVQLLDKTRKIGKLLHNNSSSKVVFNDICKVMKEILSSNVLVISRKGKVLGVSKLARIVDMFARRFQIQERMTEEIANAIMLQTGAEGVGVVIKAKHLCMMMRGVEKQNSEMTTSAVLGSFRSDEKVRQEFLSLIG